MLQRHPGAPMVVAIIALAVAMVGTAVASTVEIASLNKRDRKIVTSIAKKTAKPVANKRITARAKNLSVLNATNATNAANADKLGNLDPSAFARSSVMQPFSVRANYGEVKTIVTNESVSLVLECTDNDGAGRNAARILAATTRDGAFLSGVDDLRGPGFSEPNLNAGTPENDRVFTQWNSTVAGADKPTVVGAGVGDVVQGFEGATITIPNTAIGLNVQGVGCTVNGVAILTNS